MPKPTPTWAKLSIGACLAVIAIVRLLPDAKTLDAKSNLARYTSAPQDHRATLINSFLSEAARDIAAL